MVYSDCSVQVSLRLWRGGGCYDGKIAKKKLSEALINLKNDYSYDPDY